MTDEPLDLSWAEEQVASARVPIPVGQAIMALLKTWGELAFPSEAQQDQALDIFRKLAKDEAIVEVDDDRWEAVQVGFMLQVGDTVRVRSNAFNGQAGRTHNGRIGKVVAKRSGDIIVRTTDGRLPALDGAHYPPSALEVKVN